jgi:hypothetical protein
MNINAESVGQIAFVNAFGIESSPPPSNPRVEATLG